MIHTIVKNDVIITVDCTNYLTEDGFKIEELDSQAWIYSKTTNNHYTASKEFLKNNLFYFVDKSTNLLFKTENAVKEYIKKEVVKKELLKLQNEFGVILSQEQINIINE